MAKFEPIFIISLPRSGSTLLQRILSTSSDIDTCSEPWVALPLCYMLKDYGVSTEYGKDWENIAIHSFLDKEKSIEIFYEAANEFLTKLYSTKIRPNSKYFLDKTPRYHLIINDLKKIFPNAKFVFLLRNPLAIVASSISTWGKSGHWNIHAMKIDLYKGLRNIVNGVKYQEDICIIHYEQLVINPKKEISILSNYLEICEDSFELTSVGNITIEGPLGDPSGLKKYNKISVDSIKQWPSAFCNPLRRYWARRYLKKIGKEDLAILGYSIDELLTIVREVKGMRFFVLDVIKMVYGLLYVFIDVFHFKNKFKNIKKIDDIVGFR